MGAFSAADLAARDGLPALWFRLERADDPAEVVAIADALIAWLARHPGLSQARAVFVELLSAVMARSGVGPQVAEDFLDMRSRLLERAEQWQQEWLREGRQEGRREGEVELLLRQLERRFGALADPIKDRVRAADIAALEEWGVRILDARSLDDVLGDPPG